MLRTEKAERPFGVGMDLETSEAVISMDTVFRHIKRKMYIAQIQKYIHTYISIIKEKGER